MRRSGCLRVRMSQAMRRSFNLAARRANRSPGELARLLFQRYIELQPRPLEVDLTIESNVRPRTRD